MLRGIIDVQKELSKLSLKQTKLNEQLQKLQDSTQSENYDKVDLSKKADYKHKWRYKVYNYTIPFHIEYPNISFISIQFII